MRSNRTTKQPPGQAHRPSGQVTGSADAQDRLLSLGAETFGYDLHGRVAGRSGGGQSATYAWDAWGRLRTAVVAPMQPQQTTVTYRLDPAGRRIGRRLLSASGALIDERGWVYDGALRAVAEVDGSGKLRARFVYATLGHSPDAVVTFAASGAISGVYLLVHDAVGSPVLTVNADGGVETESIDFAPWGEAAVAGGGSSVHPFGFAGGLWDRGTGLVRFGAREYDAGVGRWLARDPIGFGGGWNQYGYVGNLPTVLVDPAGLAVELCKSPLISDGIRGVICRALPFCRHQLVCTGKGCYSSFPEFQSAPYGDNIMSPDSRRGDCEPLPNVDERCIDSHFDPGKSFGPYEIPGNNCQTTVASLISACPAKSPFQSMIEWFMAGTPGNQVLPW